MKYRETAEVLECIRIAADIFSLKLRAEKIASAAKPGQFVSVYARDSAHLLPRPISICEADAADGVLRLVFRIVGAGTAEFSTWKAGDAVELTGPLGNGFPLEAAAGKRVFLIGGGIGIPPMLELAKHLTVCSGRDIASGAAVCPGTGIPPEALNSGSTAKTACREEARVGVSEVTAVLGYRDELFLAEDFPCRTIIAAEDGSAGTKGNVLDAIAEHGLSADVIFACGPVPMLRALKRYASDTGTECWLSMEEKMACGIGACLSCVCRSTETDEHSQVKNKRVCTEGPVFRSAEIEL